MSVRRKMPTISMPQLLSRRGATDPVPFFNSHACPIGPVRPAKLHESRSTSDKSELVLRRLRGVFHHCLTEMPDLIE
jgi:hypothetical protein